MRAAICFDLDGTISTMEILPCIAAELGIADEIATLTRLTIDGHIGFRDSLRLRTLILGTVPVRRVHEIVSAIPLEPAIVRFIRENSDRCFVATGNLDIWIRPLLEKLACPAYTSNAVEGDGRVNLTSVLDKSDAVRDVRRTHSQVIAVGDGNNDVPMLKEADIAIAYGGVHPPSPSAAMAANILVNSADTLCSLLKAL